MNDAVIYDDEVQLFRAAGIAVTPTLTYLALPPRLAENPRLLDAHEIAPFVPRGDLEDIARLPPQFLARYPRAAAEGRASVAKLARAGVVVGVGTDTWQIPTAVHLELDELVAAGLSPAQAIRAGTSSAARIIGAASEFGTIEAGKRADLLILDADPTIDIRNTRRISAVVQDGRVVDRGAILAAARK